MLSVVGFVSPATLPLLRIAFRPLSTVAQLVAPNGLPNARDLASAAPSLIRPGRLFRGSTPANLVRAGAKPSSDILQFLRTAGLLVDLRSKDERRQDDRQLMAWACGQTDFESRERHISLLNKRRVVWGLFRVLPRRQLRLLVSQIIANPLAARAGVTSVIDQGGLALLNRILVEAGASSIGTALNEITDALQHDAHVYFYCSAGKDRTGLLTALILKVLGVPDREVIYDYTRSSETWENGPLQLRSEYSGMFWTRFCSSFFFFFVSLYHLFLLG